MLLDTSIDVVDSGILASVGSILWKDKGYTISSLPSILEESKLASMPYEILEDTNVRINIDKVSTIYLAIHSSSISDNLTFWLQTNDWTNMHNNKIAFNGENGTEYLTQIWFKEFLGIQDLNVTVESEPLVAAVFIKPGTKYCMRQYSNLKPLIRVYTYMF